MAGTRSASYQSKPAFGLALMVPIICLLTFSCDSKPETAAGPDRQESGIHETVEKDGLSVAIDTDKKEMTTAERLHLTIRATCPEGWTVSLPAVDHQFGEFLTVGYDTARPQLAGENKKIVGRLYILEPFLAGDYPIPPTDVKFKKDEKLYEINTPGISITVKSLLPPSLNKENPRLEINDIKPPLSLPLSFSIWVWTAVVVAAVVMVIAAVVLVLRKRKPENGEKVTIDPADAALRALEQLAAEKLEEKGESKVLYHGVSAILRRYIEQLFGIRAPEQTTEEFLAGLEKGSGFPENYNRLLRDFLRHCDLVKFAEHQPRASDIQNTFSSCREFIKGTRERRTDAL